MMDTFSHIPFTMGVVGHCDMIINESLIADISAKLRDILEKFDDKMAIEILLLRIFIQGMMLGTLFSPSFIISLTSGGASTLLTILLFKYRKNLSLIAICISGAFVHNLTQLIVVYFLLFRSISIMSKSIFIFIWGFLFMGCVSGLITGYICERLQLRRER